MLTIDFLKDYGADVGEGLQRCMNNEAFYLRLVGMAINDKNFEALETAVAARDLSAAFEAAHGLKGVLGNLALTPLYKPVYDITELLRAGTDTDYAPLLSEIREKRAALVEAV